MDLTKDAMIGIETAALIYGINYVLPEEHKILEEATWENFLHVTILLAAGNMAIGAVENLIKKKSRKFNIAGI